MTTSIHTPRVKKAKIPADSRLQALRWGRVWVLIAAIWLVNAAPAAAQVTVTLVGTGTATGGATTTTATLTSGVTAGNSIILTWSGTEVSSVGSISAADAASNTYAVDVEISDAVGISSARTGILSAHNVTAVSIGQTVTVSHPALLSEEIDGEATLSVLEVTGLAANPLDKTTSVGESGTASRTTGTTATTSFVNELLISAFGIEFPTTFTPGAGQTVESSVSGGGDFQSFHVAMSQQVSTTGTFAHTGTVAPPMSYPHRS